MPEVKTVILVLLGVIAALFIVFWVRALIASRASARAPLLPTPYQLLVGLVTDFLDTLGIGSFAVTTAFYRARKTVPDELIPGTLNVGHTLPTICQAFLFIDVVKVEPTTLVAMIAAAVLGAVLGAPIVSRWPRRWVQIGLGWALIALGTVLVIRQFGIQEVGTDGLQGAKFWIGVACNFGLGALMTIGVGLYAPCLVLVAMLGMNPNTGFPIMMGSCAFLMPLASSVFVKRQRYAPGAALGLTLGGIPAVMLAVLVFENLFTKSERAEVENNLWRIKWLVAVVIAWTAINLLRTAHRERARTGRSSTP